MTTLNEALTAMRERWDDWYGSDDVRPTGSTADWSSLDFGETLSHNIVRTDVPRLLAAVEAVLAEHRQLRFHQDYDRCGHTEDEHTICHSADGDPLCEQTYTLSDPPVCEVCLDEMGYHLPWPCETYQAVTTALAGGAE